MRPSIIFLTLSISIFYLSACKKNEQAVEISPSSSEQVAGPRTVCIDYWHEQEEDSIGFVMEASWSEHSSEVSVENITGITPLAIPLKLQEPIINHLFSFFDIDLIRSFEVNEEDFRAAEHFHFVVFDSIDFKYKYYQIQDNNISVKKWITQFEDLHKKSKKSNKMLR